MISIRSKEKIILEILEKKQVNNKRILQALVGTPRELFYEGNNKNNSYRSTANKYYGSWLLSDIEYLVDILSNIDLHRHKTVLEIGSGNGYVLAVLSKLFDEVYGIEIDDNSDNECWTNLDSLGIVNVLTKKSDGYYGYDNDMKFDIIIVNCGMSFVPPLLLDQLKMEGVIIIPLGNLNLYPDRCQSLTKIIKSEHNNIETKISDVFVTPMVGDIEKIAAKLSHGGNSH